jgi:hypothetical protein
MKHSWIAAFLLAALPAFGAAPSAAPATTKEDPSAYQHLVDAARAVVGVKVKALANARSNRTLGSERAGSGVVFGPRTWSSRSVPHPRGRLGRDHDEQGDHVPAAGRAYDPATGFGCCGPLGTLDTKPIRLGHLGKVESLDRMLVAATGGGQPLGGHRRIQAPVRGLLGVPHRRGDLHLAAAPGLRRRALINKEGELVGIGSLFVMECHDTARRAHARQHVRADRPAEAGARRDDRHRRQKGAARPWLGVSSMEEDGRLKVIRVSSDGPAEKAGIEPGDIILQLSGKKIENLPDFYRRPVVAGAPGVGGDPQGPQGLRRRRREGALDRPLGETSARDRRFEAICRSLVIVRARNQKVTTERIDLPACIRSKPR